jgi:hypothetical protein
MWRQRLLVGLGIWTAATLTACGSPSSSSSKNDAGVAGASGGAAGSTGGVAGAAGHGAAGATDGGAGASGGAPAKDGASGDGKDAPTAAKDAKDATTGDGGDLGGASRCAPGKYIVCESFEDTAAGAIPVGWARQGDATSSGVDFLEAARGSHSLKLEAAPNGPRRITMPATAFGGEHWGRLFYKVKTPAPKPAGGVVHSTLVGLSGVDPQKAGADEEVRVVDTVENTAGKHQFLYNVQTSMSGEFGTGSDYDWTYDGAWHCAEWHLAAASQTYQFFFDRQEIKQITKVNGPGKLVGTGIPPGFSTIAVGWYNYQSVTPGFVAWIDEIAIDSKRIGCDK